MSAPQNAAEAAQNGFQTGGSFVISGTVDPTALAVYGLPGWIYIKTDTQQIFIKSDSGLSVAWTEKGGSAAGSTVIPQVSPRYYGSGAEEATTNFTVSGVTAADILVANPVFVPVTISIDQVSWEVSTLQVGGLAKIGIYDGNAGIPNNLIVESGDLDTSSTGLKTDAVNAQLVGGNWYWLAIVFNNVATLAGTLYPPGIKVQQFGSPDGLQASSFPTQMEVAHAYGALPDPFGAAVYSATGVGSMAPMFRVA